MSTRRRLFHGIVLLVAGVAALVAMMRSPDFAYSQQLGEGMVRTGIVGIQNDDERKLFYSLICTCGCPRETLGTCTCGFALQRRDELRAELAKGRAIDQIQAEYADRFGPQALAVPPNTGGNRFLYLFPIGAIVAGAAFVIMTVRRWKRRGDAGAEAKPARDGEAAPASRDDYDDKLDDELKNLDRE
jgi:cytochrome c-type biogenesis protein CcmH